MCSLQDFEGQKLADLLATLLLSASGVSSDKRSISNLKALHADLPSHIGSCVHHRIHFARHQARSLRWLGRNRTHIPPCRASLALFQATSSQVARTWICVRLRDTERGYNSEVGIAGTKDVNCSSSHCDVCSCIRNCAHPTGPLWLAVSASWTQSSLVRRVSLIVSSFCVAMTHNAAYPSTEILAPLPCAISAPILLELPVAVVQRADLSGLEPT